MVLLSVFFCDAESWEKFIKKKVKSCSQSFRVAHLGHVLSGDILYSVQLSSLLIVIIVFLKHMLHLVKKPCFGESY